MKYTRPEFAKLEFSQAERARQFAQVAAEWNQAKLEDAMKWRRFEQTFQRNNEFARRQRTEEIERQRCEAMETATVQYVEEVEGKIIYSPAQPRPRQKSFVETPERRARRDKWEEAESRRIRNTVTPLPREIMQTVEMRENERGAYLPFRVCDRPFHLMKPIPSFPRRAKKVKMNGNPAN